MQIQMKIIISRGSISLMFRLFSFIISNPHVAGNILPAAARCFGSISAGNIMPESIRDGRNMNWDTMVSFDVFLTVRPKMLPRLKLVKMKTASIEKYKVVFLGTDALKAAGATK